MIQTPSVLVCRRTRAGVIGKVEHPGKAIQAIADGYIYRLSKDPVPPVRVGNHLQFGNSDQILAERGKPRCASIGAALT